MTAKELRKLRRRDLLEILLTLRKENDLLRQQLAQAQQALEDRRIKTEDSESLAEAALRISGVFEAAQAACELYRENVRLRWEELEREAQSRQEAAPEITEDRGSFCSWPAEIMDETE